LPARSSKRLTRQQILDGLDLTLQNARELQEAALASFQAARAASLALAQIGQEELGKGMLLLMALTFDEKADWREFWRRWNSHDLKANAASLFEWLDPLHITLKDPEGREFDGIGARGTYSAEKEAGLYVDFDEELNGFVQPAWKVPVVEAMGRILTLGALALTATALRRTIEGADKDFRADLASRHMRLLWNGFRSQEDMSAELDRLADMSERHAAFVRDLKQAFEANRVLLRGVAPKTAEKSPPAAGEPGA
jgi:AbiV family abortive infection protein